MSSKENDEECVVMHSKRGNIEIMINNKANEFIEEFFQLLLSRYQIGLETLMKGSEFICDCVYLFHYKCYKIVSNVENHI